MYQEFWYVDVANQERLASQEPLSNGSVVTSVTYGPFVSRTLAESYCDELGYDHDRIFSRQDRI